MAINIGLSIPKSFNNSKISYHCLKYILHLLRLGDETSLFLVFLLAATRISLFSIVLEVFPEIELFVSWSNLFQIYFLNEFWICFSNKYTVSIIWKYRNLVFCISTISTNVLMLAAITDTDCIVIFVSKVPHQFWKSY